VVGSAGRGGSEVIPRIKEKGRVALISVGSGGKKMTEVQESGGGKWGKVNRIDFKDRKKLGISDGTKKGRRGGTIPFKLVGGRTGSPTEFRPKKKGGSSSPLGRFDQRKGKSRIHADQGRRKSACSHLYTRREGRSRIS